MIVTRLELRDFRNYEEAEIELGPGPRLIVGSNGQGKTNLVEAVVYLATLGSHRVSTDQALIRAGQDSAIVRARLEHADRSALAELQLNRSGANRAQLNRVAIKPRELPRHVAAVLFAPEDLAIVRGDPGGRRRFLDQLLAQLSPRMAGVAADYERVVRQRTTLLKSARGSRVAESQLSTLELWDERLVDLGTQIIAARLDLVDRLAPRVAEAYRDVAGPDHTAELGIRSSVLGARPDDDAAGDTGLLVERDPSAIAERFRGALAERRRDELDRGLTLVGPHRDDLHLVLNTLPARSHASHGESWSFALALKLGSAQLLRAESPIGDPVVILDDVFAELDARRRQRLAEAIADFEQVLITAAVHEDVPDSLAGDVVRIRAGRVLGAGEE